MQPLLRDIIDANDRRYEQRFVDSKTAVEAALSAAKEAVIKAEVAADKRFEGVNEFRAALSDQQIRLISRTEVQAILTGLEARIENFKAQADTRIDNFKIQADEKLNNVRVQMDRLQNERLGIISWFGSAAAVMAFLLVVASLIVLFLNFS